MPITSESIHIHEYKIFYMVVGKISDTGQVHIPLPLREKYNLNSGDIIILEEREEGLLLVPWIKLSKFTGAYAEKGL